MKISKFSQITGVSASTLRYYESKGLIRVVRNSSGYRDFSEKDIEWAKFLQKLKNTGMSLKNMKKYSDLRYEGDSTISERLKLLLEHKKIVDNQIKLWAKYSKNLEEKIQIYISKENEQKR